MKYFLPLLICLYTYNLTAQDTLNMSLFGQFDRGDDRYSGSWAYIDETTEKEYALLGTTSGTAIYDISTTIIEELAFIEGPYSRWREITVIGQYAYVVTEGTGAGEGMQVIDLTGLPNTATLLTTYSSTFTRGHIIQRDIHSEIPYVYVNGTCGTCGVNIMDVSDPENPVEVGNYKPGYYIHDSHIKGDFLYAAAFFNGTIDIVDISDKTNPILIAQIDDPGGKTHSASITEDNQYLLISDEADGLPSRIWNISDLENLFEVATYTANEKSLTHNPYVRGDFAFYSHNTEGIRVVDIKDPSVPVEVGYYDVYEGPSGGFNGLWSACPYYPSGKIIGGNREDGLYVWTFNNTLANRFKLTIIDSITGEVIETAIVQVQETKEELLVSDLGIIKYGTIAEQVSFFIEAEGYESQTIEIQVAEENVGEIELQVGLVSKTVSISSLSNLPGIQIRPNPFSIITTFDLSALVNPSALIITDVFGHIVQRERVGDTASFSLSGGALSNGVYYYLIYDEERKPLAVGKFMVGR